MSDADKKSVGDLIREAWGKGDPTAWFEEVYARADRGEGPIPWALRQPNPEYTQWADEVNLSGERALVVGCGLGDDAEDLARRGFAVTAFDISPTAIAICKQRFPDTQVDYQVADLLDLPEAWHGQFDFVLENRTIQALPTHMAEDVIGHISRTVAPSGRVLVICHGRDPEQEAKGIPWQLSRDELAHFESNGLTEESFEDFNYGRMRQFRVAYKRDASV